MSILTITKTLFKSVFHGPYIKNYSLDKKMLLKIQGVKLKLIFLSVYFVDYVKDAVLQKPLKLKGKSLFGPLIDLNAFNVTIAAKLVLKSVCIWRTNILLHH